MCSPPSSIADPDASISLVEFLTDIYVHENIERIGNGGSGSVTAACVMWDRDFRSVALNLNMVVKSRLPQSLLLLA
jgi:hypothetical protein